MLLDREVQPLEPVERLRQLVGLDLDEEAEVAEVDAEHRHRPPRDHPQCAEHRAVAAEAHDRVGLVGQLGLGDDRHVAAPARRVGGAHQQPAAVRGRPRADRVEHGAGVPAGVQDERDPDGVAHAGRLPARRAGRPAAPACAQRLQSTALGLAGVSTASPLQVRNEAPGRKSSPRKNPRLSERTSIRYSPGVPTGTATARTAST